ncbi:unnamed protein product [Cuscuta epithymum]|uniref:Glycosyltransferase n=1 Tax=Cuscuta epithymum TaxID=186058 RepID=A0AAV0EWF9_9ASTE|nr:unnamed protein product [Cuscuta epithymum]
MAAQSCSTPGKEADVAVVMVPLPAQGHLNQLLHLSRLISARGIPVHYVGSSTHIRQATTRVHGWDPHNTPNLHFHAFPLPPQFESHQPPALATAASTKFPSHLFPVFEATEQHLRQPIADLVSDIAAAKKRVAVIADELMGWVVPSVIQKAEVYRFRCVSAFCTYSYHWEAAGKPVVGKDADQLLSFLPSGEGCFPPEYLKSVKLQRRYWKEISGDIVNSNREIEAPFLDLLRGVSKGLQWAVGPFNPISFSNEIDPKNRHKSLEWLDNQEKDSVLFVSFGTTTPLSGDQITELAIGLEQSTQNFIWVLRDRDRGDLSDGGGAVRADLPDGYEERTRERGLVVRDWAPQLEILGHASTGGFLSHCGWNSCMESISMGVPVAAWPMHSDQPRNATLITRGLKVGISLMDWDRRDEIVNREGVAEGVKKLMASKAGEEVRQNAVKLSESLKMSISSGAGRAELESFISHIRRDSGGPLVEPNPTAIRSAI